MGSVKWKNNFPDLAYTDLDLLDTVSNTNDHSSLAVDGVTNYLVAMGYKWIDRLIILPVCYRKLLVFWVRNLMNFRNWFQNLFSCDIITDTNEWVLKTLSALCYIQRYREKNQNTWCNTCWISLCKAGLDATSNTVLSVDDLSM